MQRFLKRILEFKESLTILLVAWLFVLLAANVEREDVIQLGLRGIGFALALIVIVRPLAVLTSTIGTRLVWRDRLFLAWIAPRGIVAAAISSVFAARLGESAAAIVPATLVVILVTVTVYGLSAPWVARRLGLSNPSPQGLLVAGAGPVARRILAPLIGRGFPIVVVDTQYDHIRRARQIGLTACFANILSEHIEDEIDMSDLGRFLGLTSNEEVNALACARFREFFGPRNIFQLASQELGKSRWTAHWLEHLAGQRLFDPWLTYDFLSEVFAHGAQVKVTTLTDQFDYQAYLQQYGKRAWPLFVLDGTRLHIVVAGRPIATRPGQAVVSLLLAEERASQAVTDPAKVNPSSGS